MYKQPEGGALIYPYITPGSRQYARVLWDWDSWLSDVALRQILADTGTDADRREALTYEQGCVLNYLAYTSLEDGYMPMVVDAESDPAKMKPKDIYSTNMHKPVIAQHAAFITQQNGGDATWLREVFSRIQAFIRNYQEHHRHEATGLFYWQDDLAIGVDNDPSTFFRPKGSSASIYLNCLMYKELQAMAYLARQLNLTEVANQYSRDAMELIDAVREYCWDEKDGMYYSVDLNLLPYTGEPQIIFGKPFVLHEGAPRDYPCLIQRIGCWSGFMTLWAGIATQEQAARMVKENLLDERTFCAHDWRKCTTCAPPTTPPTGRDRYGASPIIWCSGGWLTTASTRRRGNWRKRPSASLVKTSKKRAPSTNIITLTQGHPSSTRDFKTGTTSC